MSRKLQIALIVNNIVLAWAIVWLNSGQVNLQASLTSLTNSLRSVAETASRAYWAASESGYYIDQIIRFIQSAH